MKLIPKKYTAFTFSFLTSFFMSCIMSLIISLINVGLVDGIIAIWLKAWGIGFLFAFPSIVAVSPIVETLVNILVEQND